jgi:DDE domain
VYRPQKSGPEKNTKPFRPAGASAEARAVERIGEEIEPIQGLPLPSRRQVRQHDRLYLSPTRNTAAAKRFLGKALKGLKRWELSHVVNTDKPPTYAAALAELKEESNAPEDIVHRQVKYLTNVVEADHGKLKQPIRPVRGFKTLKTAYATIKGFEVMRALRKGQASVSTSRVTSPTRRASSSALSGSAPALPWRPSGSSASGLNAKQPDGAFTPSPPPARRQQIAREPCPARRPRHGCKESLRVRLPEGAGVASVRYTEADPVSRRAGARFCGDVQVA